MSVTGPRLFALSADDNPALAAMRRHCRIRPVTQCPDCGGVAGTRAHSYGRCDACTRAAYRGLRLDVPAWVDG